MERGGEDDDVSTPELVLLLRDKNKPIGKLRAAIANSRIYVLAVLRKAQPNTPTTFRAQICPKSTRGMPNPRQDFPVISVLSSLAVETLLLLRVLELDPLCLALETGPSKPS